MAAKEKTASGGAPFAEPKTRVWGLPPGNQNGIGGCWPVTSTFAWGWGHIYGGTASDGLDNRYYSNAYGRFTTPDPSTSSEDPKTPQSWNRYPYVLGDPINGTDPNGLDLPESGIGDPSGGDPWGVGGGVCSADPYDPSCTGGGGFCDPSQGPCPLLPEPTPTGGGEGGSPFQQSPSTGCTFSTVEWECTFNVPSLSQVWNTLKASAWVLQILLSKSTSRDFAPTGYTNYNTGRDSSGKCNPLRPPLGFMWPGSSSTYWHWLYWNLNPQTCEAILKFGSGPNPPPGLINIGRRPPGGWTNLPPQP